MLCRRIFNRLRINQLSLIWIIILSFAIFVFAFSIAGSPQDSDGNTITQDLICIGGAVLIDSIPNTIECAVGQSFVGISASSTGSSLTHGVFYPPDTEISDDLSGVMLH
jgi:hypothetical protein